MIQFVTYNSTTGLIYRVNQCDETLESIQAMLPSGIAILPVDVNLEDIPTYQNFHYVDLTTMTIIDRPMVTSLAQQALTMLQAGIHITCTTNPTLDGRYSCSTEMNNEEGNILSALNAGLTLPNDIVVRLDIVGQPHMFSIDKFKALCQAKLLFQLELNTIIGSNQGTLPILPVQI